MRRRPWQPLLMTLPPIVLAALFVAYPALTAVLYSLGDAGAVSGAVADSAHAQIFAHHGLTLAVYRQLFINPQFRADVAVSLTVTLWSVLVVLFIGYAVAYYYRFGRGARKSWTSVFFLVPMFIPVVIASYAIASFFNVNGWFDAGLFHLGVASPPVPSFTNLGVILAQIWVNIPFAVLLLGSSFGTISPSLIEAARDIGAGAGTVFWRIILPLTTLQGTIVATFTAIGIFGSFTIPYLIGPNAPQMLGVSMDSYYSNFSEPQQAEAMAVVAFVLAAVAGVPYLWATARARNASRGVA